MWTSRLLFETPGVPPTNWVQTPSLLVWEYPKPKGSLVSVVRTTNTLLKAQASVFFIRRSTLLPRSVNRTKRTWPKQQHGQHHRTASTSLNTWLLLPVVVPAEDVILNGGPHLKRFLQKARTQRDQVWLREGQCWPSSSCQNPVMWPRSIFRTLRITPNARGQA